MPADRTASDGMDIVERGWNNGDLDVIDELVHHVRASAFRASLLVHLREGPLFEEWEFADSAAILPRLRASVD